MSNKVFSFITFPKVQKVLFSKIIVSPKKFVFTLLGRTPLHKAANNGHLEVCQLIMRQIFDKCPKDRYGLTPSDLARKKGHYDIVQLFKSKMPKIDQKIKEFYL